MFIDIINVGFAYALQWLHMQFVVKSPCLVVFSQNHHHYYSLYYNIVNLQTPVQRKTDWNRSIKLHSSITYRQRTKVLHNYHRVVYVQKALKPINLVDWKNSAFRISIYSQFISGRNEHLTFAKLKKWHNGMEIASFHTIFVGKKELFTLN